MYCRYHFPNESYLKIAGSPVLFLHTLRDYANYKECLKVTFEQVEAELVRYLFCMYVCMYVCMYYVCKLPTIRSVSRSRSSSWKLNGYDISSICMYACMYVYIMYVCMRIANDKECLKVTFDQVEAELVQNLFCMYVGMYVEWCMYIHAHHTHTYMHTTHMHACTQHTCMHACVYVCCDNTHACMHVCMCALWSSPEPAKLAKTRCT
jgi:hypothetical protein